MDSMVTGEVRHADAHKLLPRAGLDDAAPTVAGDWAPLAQAVLGSLDASQHHLQRSAVSSLLVALQQVELMIYD